MAEVLDSQNDAIIAFENTEQKNLVKYTPFNFLFSNLKCLELFKFDFTKRSNKSTNQKYNTKSPIDIPLFVPQHFELGQKPSLTVKKVLSLREVLLNPNMGVNQPENYLMKTFQDQEE